MVFCKKTHLGGLSLRPPFFLPKIKEIGAYLSAYGINQVKQGTEAKFYELCEKVVLENDLVLYDMDYLSGQSVLRLFIMDSQTSTAVVEDCVKIDRALTPYIEETDWMPEALTVEVSSPGVFRSLKNTQHFEWSVDQRVAITIHGKLDESITESFSKKLKAQKKFIGVVKTSDDNKVEIELEDENILIPIEYSLIKKAQWEPKF